MKMQRGNWPDTRNLPKKTNPADVIDQLLQAVKNIRHRYDIYVKTKNARRLGGCRTLIKQNVTKSKQLANLANELNIFHMSKKIIPYNEPETIEPIRKRIKQLNNRRRFHYIRNKQLQTLKNRLEYRNVKIEPFLPEAIKRQRRIFEEYRDKMYVLKKVAINILRHPKGKEITLEEIKEFVKPGNDYKSLQEQNWPWMLEIKRPKQLGEGIGIRGTLLNDPNLKHRKRRKKQTKD